MAEGDTSTFISILYLQQFNAFGFGLLSTGVIEDSDTLSVAFLLLPVKVIQPYIYLFEVER